MNLLQDLFSGPVGWFSIFTVAFIVGMGVYLVLYARKEIRKELQEKQ